MYYSEMPEPYSPDTLNTHNPHLHATFRRIDDLANEDVEMQAPSTEFRACVVVDTNILLHFLDTLKQFVEDIGRLSLPLSVIIPGVVIFELDRQKNRDELGWYARRASTWLLEKVKERRTVKGQANEETCKLSGNWKTIENDATPPEFRNDGLVLDCCMYFARGRKTWLFSDDKNLCFLAEQSHIETIHPSGKNKRRWSSRDTARCILGEGSSKININGFTGYNASYEYEEVQQEGPKKSDDDMMMVDEDEREIGLAPSHALDLLHLEVIGHFTGLLIELVLRVGGEEVTQKRDVATLSRYAPPWQRKGGVNEWDAHDCLEYLEEKKRVKKSNPDVGIFLSRPYSRQGARRGQDWSRRDWEVALGQLGWVGQGWEEGSIGESLGELEMHWSGIFEKRMRPTGM